MHHDHKLLFIDDVKTFSSISVFFIKFFIFLINTNSYKFVTLMKTKDEKHLVDRFSFFRISPDDLIQE